MLPAQLELVRRFLFSPLCSRVAGRLINERHATGQRPSGVRLALDPRTRGCDAVLAGLIARLGASATAQAELIAIMPATPCRLGWFMMFSAVYTESTLVHPFVLAGTVGCLFFVLVLSWDPSGARRPFKCGDYPPQLEPASSSGSAIHMRCQFTARAQTGCARKVGFQLPRGPGPAH